MNTKLMGAMLALALASGATAANAAKVWDAKFTGTGADTATTAEFFLTTGNTIDPGNGGYDILSATGTIDGVGIDGLAPPATSGSLFVDSSGAFYVDNVLFTSAPFMSNNGWAFELTPGVIGNFYATSPSSQVVTNGDPLGSTFMLHFTSTSSNSNAMTGTFSVTQVTGGVPEPTSWALMILGFGGAGAVIRNRRRMASALPA